MQIGGILVPRYLRIEVAPRLEGQEDDGSARSRDHAMTLVTRS